LLDELPPLEHIDAASVSEAVRWLGHYGERAKLLAGGTDLLGLMKDHITGAKMPMPDVLINIKAVPGMDAVVSGPDGGLRIGATVRLADLERHPVVLDRYPALAQAAASVATMQIRHMGTVGGNLCQRPWCWYFRHRDFECFKRGGKQCFALPGNHSTYFSFLGLGICIMAHPSDLAPALMALGARVRIAGPDGERSVPVEQFFKGPRSVSETVLRPADVVTAVDVPASPAGSRSAFIKHRIRDTWDFALSEVAVAWAPGAPVRIALGGVAPYPFRATDAETVLGSEPMTPASIQRAADAVLAKARPLATNAYKVDVTRAIVKRALTAVAG
jgi:xanthine dehydrogenase YagS FAD-binding subunit